MPKIVGSVFSRRKDFAIKWQLFPRLYQISLAMELGWRALPAGCAIKLQALPCPEILAYLIEICRKKLFWTPYNCRITTCYLVRHMRSTASELDLTQLSSETQGQIVGARGRKNGRNRCELKPAASESLQDERVSPWRDTFNGLVQVPICVLASD